MYTVPSQRARPSEIIATPSAVKARVALKALGPDKETPLKTHNQLYNFHAEHLFSPLGSPPHAETRGFGVNNAQVQSRNTPSTSI